MGSGPHCIDAMRLPSCAVLVVLRALRPPALPAPNSMVPAVGFAAPNVPVCTGACYGALVRRRPAPRVFAARLVLAGVAAMMASEDAQGPREQRQRHAEWLAEQDALAIPLVRTIVYPGRPHRRLSPMCGHLYTLLTCSAQTEARAREQASVAERRGSKPRTAAQARTQEGTHARTNTHTHMHVSMRAHTHSYICVRVYAYLTEAARGCSRRAKRVGSIHL